MSFPTETFQEHAAKRRERKSLQDGRAAINGRIQALADGKRSSANVREMQQLDQRSAQLDQGSRGAEHAPPVTDANSWMRAALRKNQEGHGA